MTASSIAADFQWEQTETSLALKNGDAIVWQFQAGPDDPKPFFHPVATTKGTLLTNAKDPSDHPWHLGVWFTFKSLNKRNTWTTPKAAPMAVVVRELTMQPAADFSATIALTVDYLPRDNVPLLREQRTIHVSAPDADGDYTFTSRHRFVASQEVVADKNFYGGFSCRLAAAFRNKAPFFDAQGQVRGRTEKDGQLQRPASPWMCFANEVDGAWEGLAIFDHPSNPGYPRQWFTSPNFPYFNVPLAYPDNFVFPPGEEVELRYQVLVFSGKPNLDFLPAKTDEFAASSAE